MNVRRLAVTVLASAIACLIASTSFAQALPAWTQPTDPGSQVIGGGATLPNPASKFCINCGGTLSIRKDQTGGEYGVCQFPGGVEIEEWTWYRMFPHTLLY